LSHDPPGARAPRTLDRTGETVFVRLVLEFPTAY
jgi:hypothetical protein